MTNRSTPMPSDKALKTACRACTDIANKVISGQSPTFDKQTLISSLLELSALVLEAQDRNRKPPRGTAGAALGVAAQLLAEEIAKGNCLEVVSFSDSPTQH
ncbi:hypothetical protein SB14R_10490 [Pseudomonas oryzihabitans]|nr:hypothetical protein SB14R_10490 [Pseudomonas psychrotolerans]